METHKPYSTFKNTPTLNVTSNQTEKKSFLKYLLEQKISAQI